MSLPPQFLNGIKNWIEVDIQIQKTNEELRKLRERRENMEKQLIPFMQKNSMNNVSLRYQTYKIHIGNDNTYTNLSFKFIEEKLLELLKDKKQVEIICKYLKTQRGKKSNKVLKRGFSKLQ